MYECPNCCETVTEDDAFCGSCGAKVEFEEQAGGGFCTACGHQLTPGQAFCSGCGAQVGGGQAAPVARTAPPPSRAAPTRIRQADAVSPLSPTTASVLAFIFGPLGGLYVGGGFAGQLLVACMIGGFIAGAMEAPELTFAIPIGCAVAAKQAAEKYNEEHGV